MGTPRTRQPRAGGDPGRTASPLTLSREQILEPYQLSRSDCWQALIEPSNVPPVAMLANNFCDENQPEESSGKNTRTDS